MCGGCLLFSGSRELQTRTSGTQRSLWEWCESCTPQHCVCPQKGLQHVAKFCPSCRSLRATSRFRMHTLPLLLPLRKGCGMTFQSVTRYVFCCCSKSVKYIMKVSNSGTGILIISYNRMKTSGCSWKRPHHSTPGLRPKTLDAAVWSRLEEKACGENSEQVTFTLTIVTVLSGIKILIIKMPHRLVI